MPRTHCGRSSAMARPRWKTCHSRRRTNPHWPATRSLWPSRSMASCVARSTWRWTCRASNLSNWRWPNPTCSASWKACRYARSSWCRARSSTSLQASPMAGEPASLEQALQLLRQGQVEQAHVLLGVLLKKEQPKGAAGPRMGIVWLQRSQPQAALEQLDLALRGTPGVAAIEYNRGNAFAALRQFGEAVAAFDAAIAIKPDFAEAWFNRGNSLRNLGRDEDAMASFNQALRHRPGLYQAHNAIGSIHLRHGRHDEALPAIDLALLVEPRQVEALNNRGLVLRALQRHVDALADFDRALALEPGRALLHNNRGLALQDLGRAAPALQSYDRAVELDPASADAWSNRASLLTEMHRFDDALDSAARATALDPDHAQAHNNLGIALHGLGRIADALASYERAIALKPGFPQAWNNRGNALHDLRRTDDALASFERAIELQPGYAEAINNRGMVKQDLSRFDEARADYDAAIALRPAYPEAHQRRAALSLLQGRLSEGWADYEATHARPQNAVEGAAAIPFWQGQELRGKSILLSEPNGLGDTLQFFRFVPELVRRGARVTFLGPRSSFRILDAFAAQVQFIERLDESRHDFQCWLWSLPHYLPIHSMDQLATATPYLRVDDARVRQWASLLDPQRFNIGICWQGNPARKIDAGRSIPLRMFEPLARVPGVRLVSLQKQFGLEQLQDLPGTMQVQQLDGFDEGPDAFVDSAAALQSLDLLVTADTSITHVAGATRRPVWLALNTGPEWRWMLDRR